MGGLTERYEEPGCIEADVVDPEVEKLGPAVRDAAEAVIGPVGAVVEQDAVEMGHADEDLEEVAAGRAEEDGEGGEEREGAPSKLGQVAMISL